MLASFSNSAGTMTFSRAPLRPAGSLATPQPLPESAGGVRVGCDYYAIDDEFDLPIRMTASELATFLTFWRNYARGMATSFTYTDVHAATLTVKFAIATLPQIVERAYGAYTATVRLRIQ